ncbi:unnamed protein product [Closterium sp. Naga37s-1]|nr:unnamed protein product [Closterium sp. Naga37s-1]
MADPRIRRQTYTAASQPSRGAYPRGSVPPQAQRGVGSRGSGSGRATAGGDAGSGERQPAETAEQAAERELRERREQERAQEERESDARERKAQAAERLQREQQAVVSLERSVRAKARDVESLSAQSTQMDEQASAIRARVAVLCAHSLQVNGFRAYLGAGNRGLRDCKARIYSLILLVVLQGAVKAEEIRREWVGNDVEEEGTRLGNGVLLGAAERKAEEIRRECVTTDVEEEGKRLGNGVLLGAAERKAEEIRRECVGNDVEEEGTRLGLQGAVGREAEEIRREEARTDSEEEGTKRCGAERCGAEQCGAERCGAEQCGAERCGAEQCGAERCAVEQCGADCCEENGGEGERARSKGWDESAAPAATVNAGAGAGEAGESEKELNLPPDIYTGRGARAVVNQQRQAPQSTQELVLARQTQVLRRRANSVRLEVERRTADQASRPTPSASPPPLSMSLCQKEYCDLCLQSQVLQTRAKAVRLGVGRRITDKARRPTLSLSHSPRFPLPEGVPRPVPADASAEKESRGYKGKRKRQAEGSLIPSSSHPLSHSHPTSSFLTPSVSLCQKEYRDLCLQTQVLSKRAEAVRLAVERKSAGGASQLGDGKGRREGAGERGEEGGEEGEEKGEEGGGEEGEGDEEDVELGIAMAEAELRVLQAAEKRLSSEVAAAGATNRRVLQQWERIKGFNDERSNKWAEYELIRRINQAYAHMWWNLTNGATQKALAGHVAKAGSALIGSVRAARNLAIHEATAGVALPPSWLCHPAVAQFVDAMSSAADVAAGSAAELEPAVASMARQLSGLQQQAEQQHMEVLSEWLPQLAQLQGQSRQLVARTQNASDLVSHWWKQPALGIIPWLTVEGRSMEEWAVALEAAQMQREM